MLRRMSRNMSKKVPDELKHILKTETDILMLLSMCEPIAVEQINELLKLADFT